MEYSIRELSRLAGVSTRTLRYYDEIGLLKPSGFTDGGIRVYGPEEVALLQQILFYRERGFELKTIRKILYDRDFDMLEALEDHLQALQRQQAATAALIRTVEKTITHLKGETPMSDKERFQGLKEALVRENENKHGQEARQAYGDSQMDAANRQMLNLTQEEFDRWQALDRDILALLEEAVSAGRTAEDPEAKHIAELHRQWLRLGVPSYSAPMHRGIAAMYLADERFTRYYDHTTPGCAQLLHDAVLRWI